MNNHGRTAKYIKDLPLLNSLSFHSWDVDVVGTLVAPEHLLIDDVGGMDTVLTPVRQDGLWLLINQRWSSQMNSRRDNKHVDRQSGTIGRHGHNCAKSYPDDRQLVYPR